MTNFAVVISDLFPMIAVKVCPHLGPGLSPNTGKRRHNGTGEVVASVLALTADIVAGSRQVPARTETVPHSGHRGRRPLWPGPPLREPISAALPRGP